MAAAKNPWAKNEVYPHPSHFGSHASMIEPALTEALNDPTMVVVKDEHGTYKTTRDRLDTGIADPNRYATSRIEYMCIKSKE